MSYYITHSGRKIDLLNIKQDDICLDDIAHHLTKICRYGGALPLDKHYSVASHSVNLCQYAINNDYDLYVQRALLMHDATEAYLGDVVAGLKHLLPDYKILEANLHTLIFKKYKIFYNEYVHTIVKELDTRILLDESKALLPKHQNIFKEQLFYLKPLAVNIEFDEWGCVSYSDFLSLCRQLGIKD